LGAIYRFLRKEAEEDLESIGPLKRQSDSKGNSGQNPVPLIEQGLIAFVHYRARKGEIKPIPPEKAIGQMRSDILIPQLR
jgi:hypothetical protein